MQRRIITNINMSDRHERAAAMADLVHQQAQVARPALGKTSCSCRSSPQVAVVHLLPCRTRGITGFTGKQPQPGCSKPPPPARDTSRWVAINAFDEPKPRVKGIVGYTGEKLLLVTMVLPNPLL